MADEILNALRNASSLSDVTTIAQEAGVGGDELVRILTDLISHHDAGVALNQRQQKERALFRTMAQSIGLALDGDEAEPRTPVQIISDTRNAIRRLHDQELCPLDVDKVWSELAAWQEGLRTPWQTLTASGVEFDAGTFNVVAAPTSSGKTTFLLQLALGWLTDPKLEGALVWWSSEMTRRQLFARMVAMLASKVSSTEVGLFDVVMQARRGDMTAPVYDAYQQVRGFSHRLHLLDDGDLTADAYADYVAALAERTPIIAGVVDFVQEMDPVAPDHPLAPRIMRSREQEVAGTVVRLRRLAQGTSMSESFAALPSDAQIPLVVAGQFNRSIKYDAQDATPSLEFLRESGRIEHAASVVIGLRNSRMARLSTAEESDEKRPPIQWTQTSMIRYMDTPVTGLRVSRQGAARAVEEQNPGDMATLLEAFVLKNRLRGNVGSVVPLVMHDRSGVIVEPSWVFASSQGAPVQGSTASSKPPKPSRVKSALTVVPQNDAPRQDETQGKNTLPFDDPDSRI